MSLEPVASPMLKLAFHASHEQFAPSHLLECAHLAEQAGFDSFFSSDHFHPWSEAQGQAGFSWAWVAAALARTRLGGSMICCPGYRQHPAVVAQAAATLAEMFEGRFWLAVGSGQALNERITGENWPTKDLRNERLRECAEIIRALWNGETVTHRGLVKVEAARLYTLPRQRPLLAGAAVTEKTAEWLGGWADALITTSAPPEELAKRVDAFRRGGGSGKPIFLKVGLSFDQTDELARRGAHQQWRAAAFPNALLTELRTPQEFDQAGAHVRPEDMDPILRISASTQQHVEWLAQDIALGFEQIILHNVNVNQEAFIERFGSEVLPALRSTHRLDTPVSASSA